jgi:hypothetical protein
MLGTLYIVNLLCVPLYGIFLNKFGQTLNTFFFAAILATISIIGHLFLSGYICMLFFGLAQAMAG